MNERLEPLQPLTKVIRARRIQAMRRRDTWGFGMNSLITLLLMAVAAATFLWVFHFRTVQGNDMFPAMSDGDIVLCTAKSEYVKNDIVFYTYKDQVYVGRVVAKGGDTVHITESGNLLVNGTTQAGEIVYPTYAQNREELEVNVPPGAVFILGDLRTQALDSRSFGCIPLRNVLDKVIALLRHRKF